MKQKEIASNVMLATYVMLCVKNENMQAWTYNDTMYLEIKPFSFLPHKLLVKIYLSYNLVLQVLNSMPEIQKI